MRIIEIFQSKQGEGLWTGTFSVFVRTLGCPLRCRYCDTVYAQNADDEDAGADLSPEEIVGRVLLLDQPHVVLTGGEPMASPEIVELTKLLKSYDYTITIETAGIIDLPVVCDLMSISPKLTNSFPMNVHSESRARHEAECLRPEVIRGLMFRYDYQLKFVVDTAADLEEIEDFLTRFPNVPPSRIFLMPQAVDSETMLAKAQWIMPFCEKTGFQYSPRMQILWYGNTPGT